MYYIWKEWKENIRGKGLWFALSVVVLVSIGMLFQSSAPYILTKAFIF